MKIAVMGTGMVGLEIATKLVSLGHRVTLGSRRADNEAGNRWSQEVNRPEARVATFADAASDAELVFNATKGDASLLALEAAGASNLAGKILVDVSNPLDFSQGMPPRLLYCNDTSLGEKIQAAFPATRVVKTLNTVAAPLMVNPAALGSDTALFIAGNDDGAKREVEHSVLRDGFGWKQIIDLGGIEAARGTEMFLPLWVRLWGALGTANFNLALVQAP